MTISCGITLKRMGILRVSVRKMKAMNVSDGNNDTD